MQESRNEWKNLTIFGLAVHNGKTSNSEVPIDKINIDTVSVGVVDTAIWHSKGCDGRSAAVPAGWHKCCAG